MLFINIRATAKRLPNQLEILVNEGGNPVLKRFPQPGKFGSKKGEMLKQKFLLSQENHLRNQEKHVRRSDVVGKKIKANGKLTKMVKKMKANGKLTKMVKKMKANGKLTRKRSIGVRHR